MNSEEIREKFLDFFKERDHKVIESASLVPEESGILNKTLFTTAGMQPLIPYLLGEPHPLGKRLVNVQKCVRVQDIEEVGDKTHDTFFEMMGNWSLGDYFKKEAIKWSYELLTDKEKGFGLDPDRLYITVFEGNDDAPKDTESFEAWKAIGVPEERIYFLGVDSNWWSAGDNGPCGPDTEMFYDISPSGLNIKNKEEFLAADERQEVVEIWNDVFMEYLKKDGKVVSKLNSKNVDTGSGLERLAMVLQKKDNIFDTDMFVNLMEVAKFLSNEVKHQRVLSDHVRTAIFMISDGVTPSNTDRGYILRRLIRRAMVKSDTKKIEGELVEKMVGEVAKKYGPTYPNIVEKQAEIIETINKELQKFEKTIKNGLKEFDKIKDGKIDGKTAFLLFSTHGFPIEMISEIARERGVEVDLEGFKEEQKKHQELSRAGAEQKFKS